jgi:putative membrane protein
MTIFIPYLHFISIMVLMGSLITEHILLKPNMSKQEINSFAMIDLIYGIAAVLVLGTGLLRWFVYGKGMVYYLTNPVFHAKLTLFVILAILSIFPTIKFLKWNKQVNSGQEPNMNDKMVKKILMYIRLELLILVIIPLLAVMIARGVGAN